MHAGASPLFIVFDAASVEGDTQALADRLDERLNAAGRVHEFFVVRQTGELGAATGRALHAARAAGGAVVAAGTDGTLHAVTQAVWNASLPLGLLPLGGTSPLARAYGIPGEPDAALDVLLHAHVESVPVGMLGDRIFLLGAGIDMYPGMSHGLAHAARRALTLELHQQGRMRLLRARALFVGADVALLHRLGMQQALTPAPGQLLVTAQQPMPLWRTAWQALRGARGGLEEAESIDSLAFDRLVLRSGRGQKTVDIVVDGVHRQLATPLQFECAPKPMHLLLPTA
jgi:hypothetical protein